jgi:hypothetical protein
MITKSALQKTTKVILHPEEEDKCNLENREGINLTI